jgi:hypothetical protein
MTTGRTTTPTPRGLLAVLGLLIIGLGAFAGWLVAIPLPVVITGSVLGVAALAVWLARLRRKERAAPVPPEPGKHG